MKLRLHSISLCLLFASLHSADPSLPEGITVHLRNPQYFEGILKTEQGGLIVAEGMRLQAQKILYERRTTFETAICRIEAEGDLFFELGDYIFIGRRLEYDFITKSGVIFDGKTAIAPWFFGGETIVLHEDGQYTVYNSFLTTSENTNAEWKLSAEETHLYTNNDVIARNFKLEYYHIPFLWIPKINLNLDDIADSPVQYSVRWGGRQGPRAELSYELFSWNNWKTFLRFDYRLTRGPGVGVQTFYQSDNHKERLETINYIARDSALDNPNEKLRYRCQGVYENSFFDDKVTMNLTYDKLSDRDMATDYSDSGLELEYPGATSLEVRRQADGWIANLFATARLNSFQTIKQELPTFETTWKPFNLGSTGIISNQSFSASYLNYVYSDEIDHFKGPNKNHHCKNSNSDEGFPFRDFESPRIQYSQQFYRSFRLGPVVLTPEWGGTGIFYGNLPKNNERWLIMGMFKLEAKAPHFKEYSYFTHTLTPYCYYEYYTMPTSLPHQHYIFDLDDGLYELNMLRFGIQQTLYSKIQNGILYRPLRLDLYGNIFINTRTYTTAIPKAYGTLEFYSRPTIKHSIKTAWDFEHHKLDHFNIRTEWTISDDVAFAAEYRHRDAYAFRKADPTNFMLDSFRTPRSMLHSPLSDRRDTLLFHLFYRFAPLWAFEFQARHGWNRIRQPNYTEFEIDLLGKPQSAWEIKFSYQHWENDPHRFTVYFNMDSVLPDSWKMTHYVPPVTF